MNPHQLRFDRTVQRYWDMGNKTGRWDVVFAWCNGLRVWFEVGAHKMSDPSTEMLGDCIFLSRIASERCKK